MRLGVVVSRASHYRHLAPVVDAALARGWDVRLLHYDGSAVRTGAKTHERPAAHPLPGFRNGAPEVAEWHDTADLLRLEGGVDAAISLVGPAYYDASLGRRVPWVTVQHGFDYFRYGADTLGSAHRNCIYSDYWIDWYHRFLQAVEGAGVADAAADRFRTTAVATGFVELDGADLVDPAEVRRRWGIPEGRPVVTYLPSSACAHQQLTDWCRHLYALGSAPRRVWHAARHLRKPAYVLQALRGWCDENVVRSVRRFCDRNGALLVVRSRGKTPPRPYERDAADVLLAAGARDVEGTMDESFYPASFLEVAAVSDLVIGYHSTAVTECAFFGVPYLRIDLPNREAVHDPLPLRIADAGPEPTLWKSDGVAWRLGVPETLRRLPRLPLDAFRPDAEARDRYVRKLLGFGDGRSAERVLACLEQV